MSRHGRWNGKDDEKNDALSTIVGIGGLGTFGVGVATGAWLPFLVVMGVPLLIYSIGAVVNSARKTDEDAGNQVHKNSGR